MVFAQSWTAEGEAPEKQVLIYLDLKTLTRRYICPERALTPLGKKYAVRLELNPGSEQQKVFDWNQYGAAIAGQPYNQWGKVVLVQPLEIDVQVTGISDHPIEKNMKLVEFTWNLGETPEPLSRLIAPILGTVPLLQAAQGTVPGKGEAVMQLYDDGWRIKEVNGIRYRPASDNSFEIG